MGLTVGFLFHANMPISWAFETGFTSTYSPLPRLMREFPDLKINWHLSGPLLYQLQWKDPAIIKLIQEGVNDGQFELLGSAYAQNVMYCCSPWANRNQLTWNRELLTNFFPTTKISGFWNPERVWMDTFIPLLLQQGYSYTLMETEILAKSTLENNSVHHIWYQEDPDHHRRFFFLPDNQAFLQKINGAIWRAEYDALFQFLETFVPSDANSTVLCYAEDAEASGLWSYARGQDFHQLHDNMRQLWREFHDRPWIRIALFSEMLDTLQAYPIGKLPDGQASWMVNSVQHDGYEDWFDYAKNSPEIHYYQEYHRKIETKLDQLSHKKDQTPLIQEILRYYLASQFEFGCAPGTFGDLSTRYLLNVPGHQLWESRELISTLIEWLQHPLKSNSLVSWQHHSPHPLIEWRTPQLNTQWNPFGGRCTLCVDFTHQTIVSPNPFTRSQDRSVVYNVYPTFTTQIRYPFTHLDLSSHGNLFVDSVCIDGKSIGEEHPTQILRTPQGKQVITTKSLGYTQFQTLILPKSQEILFWYAELGLLIQKRVQQTESLLRINYQFKNLENTLRSVEWTMQYEVSPSPLSIMKNGQNCLAYSYHENLREYTSYTLLRNISTNSCITLRSTLIPRSVETPLSIFAHRQIWQYEFTLSPQETKEISFIFEIS